ncbi:hypothetical protein N5F23_06020 [Pseudomonas sichuanensis]|uniref:hypothetical protein n=1 Tax=Pseudomonas TaxID=286 RepID=UPI00244B8F0A|nr:MULTISPECIES: hypothetical protein [Pseudomonas]MDH0729693.1 hypothetical protein [Pseudomonas sichuanensis]MDH1582150.1 hypothetical protein [Pseudomonas sichuanensis]MDH1591255.1 hypothetical protein [Pseudomonas sichuanensis]MDH1596857.1 hypothetical protein [Pseudomonas sichuanensis]MDU9401606.1 hypothetical protein [Pseudomonas sp. zfem004]
MKNKVWIAVSTMAGLVAGAAGFIAVFFPDALNLQKKQMREFEVEIVERADVDQLDAFLEQNTNRIVNLTVSVCRTRERSDLPVLEQTSNALVVRHDDCEDGSMCTSTSYYFAKPEMSQDDGYVWGNDKFAACRNDEHGGLFAVSGYFMVPSGPGFGQGNLEWLLTPVDGTQIALKDY